MVAILSVGDRVKVSSCYSWAQGAVGTIAHPPENLHQRASERSGEPRPSRFMPWTDTPWIGHVLKLWGGGYARGGDTIWYWVAFDSPLDDGSGREPFLEAEFEQSHLIYQPSVEAAAKEDLRARIRRFLQGNESIAKFEQWVYDTEELNTLRPDLYTRLLWARFDSEGCSLENELSEIASESARCECLGVGRLVDGANGWPVFSTLTWDAKHPTCDHIRCYECRQCGQFWLVATQPWLAFNDEDDYHRPLWVPFCYMHRLTQIERTTIENTSVWPAYFDTYERLLQFERNELGQCPTARLLQETQEIVSKLQMSQPSLDLERIGNLLAIEQGYLRIIASLGFRSRFDLISVDRAEGDPVGSTYLHGMLIYRVDPASRAQAAGLKCGDLVLAVNDEPVHSECDYEGKIVRCGGQATLTVRTSSGIVKANIGSR